MAKQALNHIHSNPYGLFPLFNGPQLTAIEAALTRRLTLIQGPPVSVSRYFDDTVSRMLTYRCSTRLYS
jgi:hypothetical protein